jgi:acyl-CoA synthetase (NDP forming)
VAIIGASDNPDRIGGRPLDFLRRFGFAGSVYPINPNRPTVQGLPSYPDLSALPEVPDVALIVVSGDDAVSSVQRCAEAGVGCAIVLASGFGETSADGRRQQDQMLEVARQAGMRIMGPNCQGVANFSNGAILTFSTMFIEQAPMDGPIAVISQSGSMSQVPYGLLRARGHGVRYCAATGNEADVTAAEVAAAVAADPEVRLILLYLETVRDSAWLADLGRIAAQRGLPVVALKAGSTAAGQVAAASHTGALANEDRVVSAFLERVGIYRARDLPDLMLAVDLYLRPGWRRSPGGMAIVSNSGASCVQCADAAVARGMPLADLAPTTVAKIAATLPAFATPRNPVDLTAALLSNSAMLPEVLGHLGDDAGVGSLVVALPVLGQGYDVESIATATVAFADTGCPTVGVVAHAPAAAVFSSKGLPTFTTEAEAVAALAQWSEWGQRSAQAAGRTVPPIDVRPASSLRQLDEGASLDWLRRAGVPVVSSSLCIDVDEAVDAFRAAGAAVVLKGCSDQVAHKSELGLVAVGLRSELEVRDAFERVRAALLSVDADAPGVLLAPMVSGREMMIGGRIDSVFGPVIVIGAGGAYVEAVPDTAILIPPFESADVLSALARLRIAPLLAGVRGEPAADVTAFAEAVVKAATMLVGPSPVVEFDVNPIMVRAETQGCVAVDALVTLDDP